MIHTTKTLLAIVLFFAFAAASVSAQPGNGDGPPKDKPQKSGDQLYVFGNVKNWKPDPSSRYMAPGEYEVALSAADPIVGESDNYCRFTVVPKGPGKTRDFSVSVIVNGREHILLQSKEAFSDAKGYYFQFGPKELGPLPKGKHKLMLVIDRGKTTLVRNEKNQHSMDFTVK